MDLDRACKCGDVQACRDAYLQVDKTIVITPGELSPLHWLMLGQITSDDDCVAIIKAIEGMAVNHRANDLVVAGRSQLERVSDVSPLHLAVLHKGVSVLNELLRMGGNPDQPDSNGETPLMYACRHRYKDKATTFIHNGADPGVVNVSGESCYSISQSDEIKSLIVVRLNAKLLRSIRLKGDVEQIEQLIRARADVNAHDTDGTVPLVLAVRSSNYDLVLKLLEADNLEVSNSDILHDVIASSFEESDKIGIIHELLFRRIDVNKKNSVGRTPLDACTEADSEIAKVLKEHGAISTIPTEPIKDAPLSPGSPREDAMSPIIRSASEPVSVNLDIGEVARRVGDLYAELVGAKKSVDTMESIVSSRASPAQSPVIGETEEDLVALKLELRNKLNMYESEFEKAKSGKNVGFKAIGNFMELQSMMASTRAEISQVTERISSGDFAAVQKTQKTRENTPSSPETVNWFRSPDSIEADIDLCIRQIRKSSLETASLLNLNSSIFEVLKRCQDSCVMQALKLLRNRGADLSYPDPQSGMTSLMYACGAGNEDLVAWLLSGDSPGNVLQAEKERGRTALHFAAISGNKRIVEMLVSKGKLSLISVMDKSGSSARELSNNPAIQRLLTVEPAQSS